MYIYLVLSVLVKDLYCIFKSEYYFKPRTIILNYYKCTIKLVLLIMHLSMLSPRGVGGPQVYVGHLISIAVPTLRNLTKNLGPRVGMFVFLHRGIGQSHMIPWARLCAARL